MYFVSCDIMHSNSIYSSLPDLVVGLLMSWNAILRARKKGVKKNAALRRKTLPVVMTFFFLFFCSMNVMIINNMAISRQTNCPFMILKIIAPIMYLSTAR